MSDEAKQKQAELDAIKAAKDQEVKITITPEVAEKIEEGFKKIEEKLEAKAKAFRFHGTESAKKELDAVEKKAEGVKFLRAIATKDHSTAVGYHDARAKALYGAKAINVTTDATGGYLVPEVFESEIFATFDSYNEIMQDADVRTFNVPGNIVNLNELDTRVVVYYTDENGTGTTGSTPTFSEPRIAIRDLLGSTDITLDFLEDTETDIMSNLSRQYGEQFAKTIQNELINGNTTVSGVVTKGLMEVAGVVTVSIGVTGSGYSAVSYGDFDNMYFTAISIDHFQEANKNGKFYMDGLTLKNARNNLRTASGGNFFIDPVSAPSLQASGRPIVITNQMPTPSTTTSNPFVLYANLKEHLKIRRKRGVTMKVNDTGTSLSGRNLNYQLGRELVVSARVGHQIVLAEGMVRLVTA